MIKLSSAILLSAAALGVSVTFAFAQTVTRIEPRPYYGATITIEEGVRVFRPLPTTKHIIINPDNRTPLTIKVDGDGNVSRPTVTNNVNVNTRVIRRGPRHHFPINPPLR